MTSGVWISNCYPDTCFIRVSSQGGFSGTYFEAVADDKYTGVLIGLHISVSENADYLGRALFF